MLDSIQMSLIRQLAEGGFHSGDRLGSQFNITRAAISKRINKLQDFGLIVDSVKGKGYKLRYPLELLSEDLIQASLKYDTPKRIAQLSCSSVTESTNKDAFEISSAPSYGVFVSEYQTAARGRRGRVWQQSFGSSLTFSVVRDFELELKKLGVMSLWAAIAISQCLNGLYSEDIRIKWPNDIFVGGRKLAGILLEAKSEVGGLTRLVIGIGINYSKHQLDRHQIDQPWISLSELTPIRKMGKNEIFALILDNLLDNLDSAELNSFSNLKKNWQQFDMLYDEEVSVHSFENTTSGICKGIDDEGNLLIEKEGALIALNAGEVSVRKLNV